MMRIELRNMSKSPSSKKDKKINSTSSKDYWTEETEKAVKEYLENDFNYYQHKIDKHKDEVAKSIEKNKNNSKSKIIELDEDFILINESMVDYASRPEVIRTKERVFREKIYGPLVRLIENIIFTYKLFIPGVDIRTLHNDCMSHVVDKFCNFDPEQNTKSFSFFGTVAKHYLQNEKKDDYKSTKTDLSFENHSEEAEEIMSFELDEESDLDSSLALFKHVIDILEEEINRGDVSKNDAKVADAIVQIFKNHEILKVYPKTAVYKLVKEHTNLETKDITYSLHRLKVLYKIKRRDFIEKHNDKYYGHDGEVFSY